MSRRIAFACVTVALFWVSASRSGHAQLPYEVKASFSGVFHGDAGKDMYVSGMVYTYEGVTYGSMGYVDNRGVYPAGLPTGTSTEICMSGTLPATCVTEGLVDLSVLVPSYIVSMPTDPFGTYGTSTAGTGYRISVTSTSSGRIIVTAPAAELART